MYKYSYDFENVKGGLNVISLGNNYARHNWWNDIFDSIEMEEAVVLSPTEFSNPFQYMDKDQMEVSYRQYKGDNTDSNGLCAVVQVIGPVYEARGYWFVPVYYLKQSEVKDKLEDLNVREAELMFNTKIEAEKVNKGSVFDYSEQFE